MLSIYIEVLNENDNVPLSQLPVYYPSIQEDSPAGTVVLQIKATDRDKDLGQQITYKIAAGNPEGFFAINASTGIITTTARKLDREAQDEHILELLWNESKLACENQGLELACPEDDLQRSHLQQFIMRNGLMPVDKYSGYWLGASRTSESAPYIWEYSKKSVGYLGWIPGEPNYYSGENCVELKNDNGYLGFNNIYCDQLKRYICETRAGSESSKNAKTPFSTYSAPQHDESYKVFQQRLIDILTPKVSHSGDITADYKLPEVNVDQTVESHFDDITDDYKLPETNVDQSEETHFDYITADYKLPEANVDQSLVETHSDDSTIADYKLPEINFDQTVETHFDDITADSKLPETNVYQSVDCFFRICSDDTTNDYNPPRVVDQTADDDTVADYNLPKTNVDQTHFDDITADSKLPETNVDQSVETHSDDVTTDYNLPQINVDQTTDDVAVADHKLPETDVDQIVEDIRAHYKLPEIIVDRSNPFAEIPTRKSTEFVPLQDDIIDYMAPESISAEVHPVITYELPRSEEDNTYFDDYYSEIY